MYVSCKSSRRFFLYVMELLRPDVSHDNDVVIYVIDSGVSVKWVLQRLRGTNVTYNCFNPSLH
jgi:hypothetical protein